jgi:hypothetical protein
MVQLYAAGFGDARAGLLGSGRRSLDRVYHATHPLPRVVEPLGRVHTLVGERDPAPVAPDRRRLPEDSSPMTPADLLGLVVLGIATSLGLAVLAGGLLAFGEERPEIEVDERVEQSG